MKPNEIARITQAINQQLTSIACDNAKLVINSNSQLSGQVAKLGDRLEGIHTALLALQPKPPKPASRLCRDCKHCIVDRRVKTYRVFLPNVYEEGYEYAKCARPSSSNGTFLVSGRNTDGYLCKSERNNDASCFCGPEAKFYEARDAK